MSSTIKIKAPAMPEPSIKASAGVCCGNFTTGGEYMGQSETLCCGQPDEAYPDHYSAAQLAARDAQWQESMKALVLHLQDAISACNSVSTCLDRKVIRDGCVMYLQTEEWCKWLEDELQPQFRAALSAITEE